jgi:hypothetical protein
MRRLLGTTSGSADPDRCFGRDAAIAIVLPQVAIVLLYDESTTLSAAA